MPLQEMTSLFSYWILTLLLLFYAQKSTIVANELSDNQVYDEHMGSSQDLENELKQTKTNASLLAALVQSAENDGDEDDDDDDDDNNDDNNHAAAEWQNSTLLSMLAKPTATQIKETDSSNWHNSSLLSALTNLGEKEKVPWSNSTIITTLLKPKPAELREWSDWSQWTKCSRTCDGGVMKQSRQCLLPDGVACKGENMRYGICNMHPCPEKQDFRVRQCASYDDVPYNGQLYKWTPHYDLVEPCALTCRGRPAFLMDDWHPNQNDDDVNSLNDVGVIVQLSTTVQDGTRCHSGSLDRCINGKCERVGCDLKIGSSKKIDACGVCGGNGSTCAEAIYQWEMAPMSPCSVSCGGGYKMSRAFCRHRQTGTEVDDALCSSYNSPDPVVLVCNIQACPPYWTAGKWSSCSTLCGPGYRHRRVYCVTDSNGSRSRSRVADNMCRTNRPLEEEACMREECPKWQIGEWSACSESCGFGYQTREVECKSDDGNFSPRCDPATKPNNFQKCRVTKCRDYDDNDTFSMNLLENIDLLATQQSHNEVYPEDEPHYQELDDDEHDPFNEKHPQSFFSRMQQDELAQVSRSRFPKNHKQNLQALYGGNEHSPEPSFMKDEEWSACSVSCGEGIRRRTYRCKIFLEYSRTIAIVNDSLCEGKKLHDEVERCVMEPCTLPAHGYEHYARDSVKVGVSELGKSYVWREQGYSSCSASCLGGVEELIINCVREDNGRMVSPYLCPAETKPETRVRTCNDRPCPPRWNYSEYTPCSKSCGIGIKTREVHCIHEVTRGGENTMVVPNSMCPQPPPADRQYCNVLDCPVRWEVGEWSSCSQTCGNATKQRKVECMQVMAQEHKIERPESMCNSIKPDKTKTCNMPACPPEDPNPVILLSNSTHIQHDPQKTQIILRVGGAAVVFFGTQVKIKCPVKNFNLTKVKWSKDGRALHPTRYIKISTKAVIRLDAIKFQDAGTYACHAGLSSAEIKIDVKAKPGQATDELANRENDRLDAEESETDFLAYDDTDGTDLADGNNARKKQQQQNVVRSRNLKNNNEVLRKSVTKDTSNSDSEDNLTSSGAKTYQCGILQLLFGQVFELLHMVEISSKSPTNHISCAIDGILARFAKTFYTQTFV